MNKNRVDNVCLLHKALYGLKQAPNKAWNLKLYEYLVKDNFKNSDADASLFIKTKKKKKNILLYWSLFIWMIW